MGEGLSPGKPPLYILELDFGPLKAHCSQQHAALPRGLVLLLPSSCQSPQHSKHNKYHRDAQPSSQSQFQAVSCTPWLGISPKWGAPPSQTRCLSQCRDSVDALLQPPMSFLRGSLPSEFLAQRSRDRAIESTQGATLEGQL